MKNTLGNGEQFLMRFNGGPYPGTRVTPADTMTWPLPDEIPVAGIGLYRKTSESQLPPQPEGSHLIRGAEYVWEDRTNEP